MGSLQEREVQRYYEPWLAAHGSSLNVAKHVESIAQLDLKRQGYSPQQSFDQHLLDAGRRWPRVRCARPHHQ